MTLLDEIEAADNISLSDPERLRTLLAKLCAYTMGQEHRIARLEEAQALHLRNDHSRPYFLHGGV